MSDLEGATVERAPRSQNEHGAPAKPERVRTLLTLLYAVHQNGTPLARFHSLTSLSMARK
jgi:hypothetical protein